jgi:hypothetical protein
VSCGAACDLRGVIAVRNGAAGVVAGAGSRIHGSIASQNQGSGFELTDGALVSESLAAGNLGPGIHVFAALDRPAVAHSLFTLNLGSNGLPQIQGTVLHLAPSLCGTAVCP